MLSPHPYRVTSTYVDDHNLHDAIVRRDFCQPYFPPIIAPRLHAIVGGARIADEAL
jgi:hypothetical protein